MKLKATFLFAISVNIWKSKAYNLNYDYRLCMYTLSMHAGLGLLPTNLNINSS